MGKITNFLVEKKDSQNNSILDEHKNNNKNVVKVSIRNKYKNHLQNVDFNYPSMSKIQENYKKNCEIVNKSKEKNQMKNNVKISKEERNKKPNIKEIKHKNSNKLAEISSNDKSIMSVIYKNNNIKLNEKKNINKYYKLRNKNYEEDKKNMKEFENIMYDNNNTEPAFQNNNNKERINNSKKIYLNNLSKVTIWRKREINKNNNNQEYIDKKYNKDNNNLINNKNNKDNNNLINNNNNKNNKDNNNLINNNNNKNNNNKSSNNNINIDSFGHKKNSKSNDISFLNITKKTDNKNINSNKNRNISILNNNQKTNVKNLVKNETDSNSNNGIKNLPKKTPVNKINQAFKSEAPKNLTTKGILSLNDLIKEKKTRHQRNLSELPKHKNILDEIMSNAENNKEESQNMKHKLNRKNTYDMGNKHGNKNDDNKKEINSNLLNNDCSPMIYVKKCEALSLAGQNELGKKKINQDSYIIIKNLNRVLNFNIFGVLDGHGENGHYASQFVKTYVIQSLKNHPSIKDLKDPKQIYKILIANNYEIISNIFIDADIQIQKEKFDTESSGTTLVLVIQIEEHIICANAGDSRAIAIYDENFEDNKFSNSKIFPLSYDCKPELPNEKKRIYKCGGVVEKSYYPDIDSEDEMLIPYRVWAKDEDYPGLAMSRSIGDTEAKKIGVIPNPQIIEYIIRYDTKYILVCSDGVWEYMKNEDCMKIANEFYLKDDPIGLCQELKKESYKMWEEIGTAIDDITIVVVFY